MKTLRIGDKYKWALFSDDAIYTILDIDKSRPLEKIGDGFYPNEVFLKRDSNDFMVEIWAHSIDNLNCFLEQNYIEIIERDFKPYNEIKNFTFI